MAIYNGGLNIVAQDISGKEDKSNKVTTWSSTTTDTNYPSEKLVKGALDTKVNTANALTYEEIVTTTDLSGKIASAGALKDIVSRGFYHVDGESLSVVINSPCLIIIKGDGNTSYYIGMIARSGYSDIVEIISNGNYGSSLSYNKLTGILSFPTGGWYECLIVQ